MAGLALAVFIAICIIAFFDFVVMIVAACNFSEKDSPEVLQTSVFVLLGCIGAAAIFLAGAVSRFFF